MAKPLQFKKRKIDPNKTKEQRDYEAVREAADFYRQNPHRYISTEIHCQTLSWWQDMIIYLAFRSSIFFMIATRGIGKSYIIAWIIFCLCVLYPRIKIVVASSTYNQARKLITDKLIGEIYNRYPNARKEIDLKNSSLGKNDMYINFFNKSQIVCVTSTENSRGARATVLVLEEDVKIKPNIRTNVLLKFLQNGERIPRYKDNPRFTNFKATEEKKKQLHITSGDSQTNVLYKDCLDTFSNMLSEDDISNVMLSFHWGFPCAEPNINMTYEDDIKPQMEKSTFNKLSWSEENEGLFSSQSEFSAFSYTDLMNLRKIEVPLIALPDYLYTDKKQKAEWMKKYYIPKEPGEIRILAIDVAVMGGDNDNTVFTLVSGFPENNKYYRKVRFIEHTRGAHSETQSIRMKQLYYDFEVDIICLDCNGNGIGIYDAGSKKQYDKDRDVTYPPFTVFNRENMIDRYYGSTANEVNPCIFGIKQDAKFNHFMLTYLRSAVESRFLELPVEENDAANLYEDMNIPDKIAEEYMKVNIETTFLIRELTALEVEQQKNSPYLKVATNIRKDRFSSLGFANYYLQLKEQELDDSEDFDVTDDEFYFEV